MKLKEMELPEGWYPKSKAKCEKEIEKLLAEYSDKELKGDWLGGVVPHAGWYFSGKLACKTFDLLRLTNNPDVVVIFGGHLRPGDLPTYYDYDSFETPLGNIERQQLLFEAVMADMEGELNQDYATDNTVEVQLPFIKYFFPASSILAFRSPPSPKAIQLAKQIAEKSQALGLNLIFIGSTDLTHYGPNYGFVSRGYGDDALKWVKETNDKEFINYLQQMEGELAIEHAIKNHSSCSSGAAVSCLAGSQLLGKTHGQLVDYYTSYDVMKNSSFVGYAGILY